MLSQVRQLIERLDVTGEHQPFAQAAERFEDDLEQAWAESEDGGGLLWLAASVGVDPQQIVVAAGELLGSMVGQGKTVGPLARRVDQQMIQVLEQVHAWEKGEKSAKQVALAGVELYDLCEDLAESYPFPPAMDHLAHAVIWLTEIVGQSHSRIIPNDVFEQGSWYLVDHAAHAAALQQVGKGEDSLSSDRYQHAYAQAMRRFASIVRGHITGAQVQEAAQRCGVWPLP